MKHGQNLSFSKTYYILILDVIINRVITVILASMWRLRDVTVTVPGIVTVTVSVFGSWNSNENGKSNGNGGVTYR